MAIKRRMFLSFVSVFVCIAVLVLLFTPNVLAQTTNTLVSSSEIKNKISSFSQMIFQSQNNTEINNITDINDTVRYVYASGKTIGIKLYCNGVMVIGTQDVETNSGFVNPAKKYGFQKGDIIKSVNGVSVSSNVELSKIFNQNADKEMIVEVLRNDKILNIQFALVRDVNGLYRAGLWVRDSSAGLGTVSFITKEGIAATLGHAVCDVDTEEILPIKNGSFNFVSINSVIKGEVGSPGEISGILDSETIGSVLVNCSIGVYGKIDDWEQFEGVAVPVANPDEIKEGVAELITTLSDGKTSHYQVRITSLNHNANDNRNLVIKVTDKELIQATGGIIQGMSGSPILQNGKFIGVVTHVFLNDPTKGYGIFADTMVRQAVNITG